MKTKWIPESPKYPGLYTISDAGGFGRPTDDGPVNCTYIVHEARAFDSQEACARWCTDNPVPPFAPVEHGFEEGSCP